MSKRNLIPQARRWVVKIGSALLTNDGKGLDEQENAMMCGAELISLPDGVQRVARALQAKNHPHMPVMLADAARTAQQAADALGVQLG